LENIKLQTAAATAAIKDMLKLLLFCLVSVVEARVFVPLERVYMTDEESGGAGRHCSKVNLFGRRGNKVKFIQLPDEKEGRVYIPFSAKSNGAEWFPGEERLNVYVGTDDIVFYVIGISKIEITISKARAGKDGSRVEKERISRINPDTYTQFYVR
jgi:hypothetical protein